MKYLVLGAGVIGTSTAYFLAKDGHEFSILDRFPGVALKTRFGNGGVLKLRGGKKRSFSLYRYRYEPTKLSII